MCILRTLTLNPSQREELIEHLKHSEKPYLRERCSAILKIAEGHSPHWVSQHGLLQKRQADTVYQWLNAYETDGLAGLVAHRQGGPRRGCP
jgi:transposase